MLLLQRNLATTGNYMAIGRTTTGSGSLILLLFFLLFFPELKSNLRGDERCEIDRCEGAGEAMRIGGCEDWVGFFAPKKLVIFEFFI